MVAPSFRRGERVVIGYFVYTALLTLVHPQPVSHKIAAALAPSLLLGAVWAAQRSGARWTEIARDWDPPALILAGYLQLEWFRAAPDVALQSRFEGWDRALLGELGLRRAVEAGGWPVHWLLELSYTLLYAIPAFCIASLYLARRRDRVDTFLSTFALGTFAAYALLPHFPTLPPREAFPGAELPSGSNVWRGVNLWLLGKFDISTSVFPSGHVAVAFSSAFGLFRALPENRRLFAGVLASAGVVYIATVYGRYHYAADGAASILISLAAWAVTEALDRYA